MRIPGEAIVNRVGTTTTAVAKFGLGFGEGIAERVIRSERIARDLSRLRAAADEAHTLQDVRQHPEAFRDDPTAIAQKLLSLCKQKDPDAPVGKHAIGIVGALIERGVDTANIDTLHQLLGEPPKQ